MLLWVGFALLAAALVIGAWCLIAALGPTGWPSSVNDPSVSEVRITCWSATVLVIGAVICAGVELLR